MSYDEMSDFEVNALVAKTLFGGSMIDFECNPFPDNNAGFSYETELGFCHFNGCNSPSDAWPIIMENNISMRPMYIRDADGRKLVEWEAIHVERDFPRESFGWDDKNPLRAAMIVFLMMSEQ